MKMKKEILAHPVLVSSVVGVLVLSVGLFTYFGLTKSAHFDYVHVQKRDITEDVFTNGQVKAVNNVDASFEISGKVSQILVSVGDKVYEGEPLVELVSDDATVSLSQAQTALASAQAQYDLTKTQSVDAGTALDEAKQSLNDQINISYTAADDAIRNDIDQVFNDPRTSTPIFLITSNDPQLNNDIDNERVSLEQMLIAWNTSTSSISYDVALNNLNQVNSFLDNIALVVNGSGIQSSLPAPVIAQYKITVPLARAEINGAIAALIGSEQKFTGAQDAYNLSLQQITRTNPDQMSSAEALVAQAQANVDKAEVALNKTVLRAPFSGVVSDVEATLGQVVSPNAPAVSIVSDLNYQIDSYVSEIDVAKLQVGQLATTTLDAYGENVPFMTKIISIAPAPTTAGGISGYKVTLQFEQNDSRVRTGMNSNSYILVASKSQVLSIPKNSIIKKDNNQYVMISDTSGKQTLQQVTTGIIGDDYVEVTSGLSEGELVANFN
jgi:HlyD family secretion protein